MTNNVKFPLRLPSSILNSHHIFGFKKKGIPYIVHLAKINPSFANHLWELKLSTLKMGKTLKVTHQKQADVDIHSVLLYKEILENILEEFSKHFKNQIKSLIISFPEQIPLSLLTRFFVQFKIMMKKYFPSMKNPFVSSEKDLFKWICFSSEEKPSKIINSLDVENDETNITCSEVMDEFFKNPKKYKPVSSINLTNQSTDNFPELDSLTTLTNEPFSSEQENKVSEKEEKETYHRPFLKFNELNFKFNLSTNYFLLSRERKETTEEEKIFSFLLNDFIASYHLDFNQLTSLDFKDKNSIQEIKKHLNDYLPSFEEGIYRTNPVLNSFKRYIDTQLNSVVFVSREELFSLDKKTMNVKRSLSQLEMLKYINNIKLYKLSKLNSFNSISHLIPGTTETEKKKFIKDCQEYFSKELYDSVSPDMMEEVKTVFANSYDASMATKTEMIDTSNALSEHQGNILNDYSISEPIKEYSDISYKINTYLRNSELGKVNEKDIENDIVNLTQVSFNKHFILQSNLTVIRGTDFNFILKDKVAGDYVIDNAWLSTTLDIKTASSFHDENDFGIFYIFYLRKGTRAMYIKNISAYPNEYELLLPPGCVFKILSIESRERNKNPVLSNGVGLIYKLLLVGTITTDVLDKALKGNSNWLKLKEVIKPLKNN